MTQYLGPGGDVVIPDGVTTIDAYAFFNNQSITSVTIPEGVTRINVYAFQSCQNLTRVTLPESLTVLDAFAFDHCGSLTDVTLSKGLTTLGCRAFQGNTSLTSIMIPGSVTCIEEGAFEGCTGLTSVVLGEGVAKIRWNAFADCTSLANITFPSSVHDIEAHALDGTPWLANQGEFATANDFLVKYQGPGGQVNIPAGIRKIGASAFLFCDQVTGVTVPDGVTWIGADAFYDCTAIKTFTLPDSVTEIGERAFSGCKSLTELTLPPKITVIPEHAFSNCENLTSMVIPDGVTTIKNRAFYGCLKLKDVFVPASVTEIGQDLFYITSDKLVIHTAPESPLVAYAEQTNQPCVTDQPAAPAKVQGAKDVRLKDPYGGGDAYLILGVERREEAAFITGLARDQTGRTELFPDWVSTSEPLVVRPGAVADLAHIASAELYPLRLEGGRLVNDWDTALTEGTDYVLTLIPGADPDDPESGVQSGSKLEVSREGYYALFCMWPTPGFVSKIAVILHVTSDDAPPPARTVSPSPCAVTLDGVDVTLNAYLFSEGGGGANYVMLRDVAYLLNGTGAAFEVAWDKEKGIVITTGSPYTAVGGELESKGAGLMPYVPNASTITVDEIPVRLDGYTIEGNNYFKLRDLGEALGFGVDWDAATGTVVIDTTVR